MPSTDITPSHRPFPLEFAVLLLILAAFVGWMLSLPCFPSTDGPVHMYYVHVLSALLSHNNPGYAHFFRIRHLLPPYSLYYYALLVLSKFMPMLLADRLIICGYFLSFVLGFRFLARRIGPSGDVAAVLSPLLLLNWPLGMGFVNFCLSLSFSFWATGLWLGLMGTANLWGRILFLLLVTGIMLTHPVPLLLLLAVTGSLLLARILHTSRVEGRFHLPAQAGADLVTLAVACLNVGYVKLFAVANPLKQIAQPNEKPYWLETASRIGIYASEHAMAFLLGRSFDILFYRLVLLLILVVPVVLAVQQRRRNRAAGVWTTGDTFFALGVTIFVVLPFIPSQLNGLYYFADRLVICVWLAFLFAASGWRGVQDAHPQPGTTNAVPSTFGSAMHLPRYAVLGCCLVALAGTTALLTGADRLLRGPANAIAALDRLPTTLAGQVGFVLEDPRLPAGGTHEGVSWNPYYWALIHLFRHNDAILANAPWMDETIIPVQPSAALPEVSNHTLQEPFPVQLQADFLKAPADLQRALADTSFFAVNQVDRGPLHGPEPLLRAAGPAAAGWSCTSTDWYRLCRGTHPGQP